MKLKTAEANNKMYKGSEGSTMVILYILSLTGLYTIFHNFQVQKENRTL